MSKEEAIKLMRPIQGRLLHNVYDNLTSEQFRAILTLVPGFEYPDWDHLPVRALWRK